MQRGDACVCVVVCVLLCTMRMVTVIAARLRMMCASVCLGVYRAYAHGRFCEAMHACDNVCLGFYMAYAHSDGC